MAAFVDYYEKLGVSPEATAPEIKAAFHQLAWRLHPDVNHADALAEDGFKAAVEAYATLSEPERRSAYDRVLRMRAATAPKPPLPDHYGPLGIRPSAHGGEIRQAFLRLSEEHRLASRSDPEGDARFQAVLDAYRVLGDPEQRRVYDAERRSRGR